MATVSVFPDNLLEGNVDENTFYVSSMFLNSNAPSISRHVRMTGPQDERWMASLKLNLQNNDKWNELEAFMHKIDRAGGFFSVYDPAKMYTRGTQVQDTVADAAYLTGTVVTAASRGASSVTIGGLKASTVGVLKANDHISITHTPTGFPMLYAVLDDTTSNGSGQATVNIRPRLAVAVAASDVVTYYKPRGVFRLESDRDGVVKRIPAGLGNVSSLKIIGAPEVATYP